MENMNGISEKLGRIQQGLVAPKNRENKFGHYKYRSCEDILEAVKPLLKKGSLILTLSDEMVEVGGRCYVKATAKISDGENLLKVDGYAREQEDKLNREGKPTMDQAQITGSASSYARKYALNGLFCIDDTKDTDTMDYTQQSPGPVAYKKPTEKQIEIPTAEVNEVLDLVMSIKEKASDKGFSPAGLDSLAQKHFKKDFNNCTKAELTAIYTGLNK